MLQIILIISRLWWYLLFTCNCIFFEMLDSVFAALICLWLRFSYTSLQPVWKSELVYFMQLWIGIFFQSIELPELPPHLCLYRFLKLSIAANFSLILFVIPWTCAVFGESAFKVFAPSSWCESESHLKLDYLIIQIWLRDNFSIECKVTSI